MKYIIAIIKPFKLEDVRESLSELGIQGMTICEVKGYGRQKGHAELYRGAEYEVNFLPKVKIELAISDDQLEPVLEAITNTAETGKVGDGKLFVFELLQAVRIRTGESGEDAL
ncbi:Nitrogen regulatory protein P-II 2 [Providencia rustigianii]|uniref:Nitrogen regulatory protein P-II n=2 Tax=Providencia rustigianii TaxID=158850 RepID=D1NZA2_9GAMM|nr:MULTISPECIES: P-II family nitrogen regulator [Providencia]EFB73800.1 nitrogen regulatory protein P-II [Providencia rustigianii DSM 4541]MTC57341.1 P-II family nitrogen regulator [Providencia rustigianii]MTC60913.1 P-II family nitrogen regulator [Providencia rustigianii]SPY77466.1 Nitrogen regulatory protein P-II 2 [Providencia rustigianii]SUC26854.1 Nitrogen regulatory protein P-II 2 [Providencia rustigianii]